MHWRYNWLWRLMAFLTLWLSFDEEHLRRTNISETHHITNSSYLRKKLTVCNTLAMKGSAFPIIGLNNIYSLLFCSALLFLIYIKKLLPIRSSPVLFCHVWITERTKTKLSIVQSLCERVAGKKSLRTNICPACQIRLLLCEVSNQLKIKERHFRFWLMISNQLKKQNEHSSPNSEKRVPAPLQPFCKRQPIWKENERKCHWKWWLFCVKETKKNRKLEITHFAGCGEFSNDESSGCVNTTKQLFDWMNEEK